MKLFNELFIVTEWVCVAACYVVFLKKKKRLYLHKIFFFEKELKAQIFQQLGLVNFWYFYYYKILLLF